MQFESGSEQIAVEAGQWIMAKESYSSRKAKCSMRLLELDSPVLMEPELMMGVRLSKSASTADQVEDEHNHGNDKKDVDESAGNVK